MAMTPVFNHIYHWLAAAGAFMCLLMPAAGMAATETGDRPFIWVRESERPAILKKIRTEAWAKSVFDAMVERVKKPLQAYQTDRDAYVRGLPVKWDAQPPQFKTTREVKKKWDVLGPAESRFDAGMECAVLYYLTREEIYARFAADILHNAIQTMLPVKTSGGNNGGWIQHNDLLYEARVIATQMPIIYDFLHDYLKTHTVYDVASGDQVDFDFGAAQKHFRIYYELLCDHGLKHCNWSALMATAQLNNLLAFDDAAERAEALDIYLMKGTSRQASLDYDYRHYKKPGDIGPESLGYALAPARVRTVHMILLERYDPSLKLLETYPNFPLALSRPRYLRYPNRQSILFGDGKRGTGSHKQSCAIQELLYAHARTRGLDELVKRFGTEISTAIALEKYDRSVARFPKRLSYRQEPLQLLWQAPQITEPPQAEPALPRTDTLPYAGIALQRNLSPTHNPEDGLMCFVGGAGFTHGHASGMNMELYGVGEVLGSKAGRSSYSSLVHRHFYRLFAGHNTMVVNGASRGQGGWQGLKINTVKVESMEPEAFQPAVSPNMSFTCSSFMDDKGSLAEATQQRTLAIIRTSPKSGFYVDIFRSVSDVADRTAVTLDGPVTDQYHDYIYRNIGGIVTLESDGRALSFEAQPERFQNDIGDYWKQPGWRYFENTRVTRPFTGPFRARYEAILQDGNRSIAMDMCVPKVAGREVARVDSPPIVYAPSPYNKKKAQTLVIRQTGEAWRKPFVVVYEPHFSNISASVKQTTALVKDTTVVGVKVESIVDGAALTHYVISLPEAGMTYADDQTGIEFKGRFAIVADKGSGARELYIGEGRSLTYGGTRVESVSGADTQASVRFEARKQPVVRANSPVNVMVGGGR